LVASKHCICSALAILEKNLQNYPVEKWLFFVSYLYKVFERTPSETQHNERATLAHKHTSATVIIHEKSFMAINEKKMRSSLKLARWFYHDYNQNMLQKCNRGLRTRL